jgi:outer membrane protein assembly factor BamB
MADTPDLGSGPARGGGSSPLARTNLIRVKSYRLHVALRLRICALIAVLHLPAWPGLAADGDWPQWRGPNRDGVSTETGLLKDWPTNGPALLWTARGLGRGYSSVSVVGDRIYTMGDGPDAGRVLALERSSGKVVWATSVGRPGGDYPGTRCTPAVNEGSVFALGQWGDLVCADATTGREIWRKSLPKDLGGKMMSGWGHSESLLVDEQRVVCTPGGSKGTLAALDKKTGAVLWRSDELTDLAAYCSVVPARIGGVGQYVQMTDSSVAGVASSDGRLLWRALRRGAIAVIPTPIVKDDLVFVTSGYTIGCHLFKISKYEKGFSADLVYSNKEIANHHGGMVRVGEHVFGHADGRGWVCVELNSGKVLWRHRSVGKGSIVGADGHLYLRSEDGNGTVALVEAAPDGYREKGRFDQPERSNKNSWAHPVVAGGRLYLRDQDVLLCYDLRGP